MKNFEQVLTSLPPPPQHPFRFLLCPFLWCDIGHISEPLSAFIFLFYHGFKGLSINHKLKQTSESAEHHMNGPWYEIENCVSEKRAFLKKKKNLEMHVQQQAMWLSIPVGISEWAKEESICLSPQICTPPLIFSLSLFYNKGKWQKQRQEREMSRAGNLHKNSMPHIPYCPRL